MLIMIFKDQAFSEFVLPNSENLDYSIILDRQLFALVEDIEIRLTNSAGKWVMNSDEKYSLLLNGASVKDPELSDEMIVDIHTPRGENLSALVIDSRISFTVFEKFCITDKITVTVGSDESNLIRYNITNLVSSVHCSITFHGGSVTVTDSSRNGVYVNHKRISGTYSLQYGDTVNIFGLNLVVLGNILCVGTGFGKVSISDVLGIYRLEVKKKPEKGRHIQSKAEFFNRAPRMLPDIHKGALRIEPPPAPQFSKKKPLFNVIGPSFTMAIPMMLGTGLSVFSTMYHGTGSGAFMFTGIITAVGSAVLGSVWAVLNLRHTRREEFENENNRYEAYGKYLIEISEKLKKQYSENELAMHTMYPSAQQCVMYDRTTPALWSRNFFHKDFLFIRLGLGDMPFQVKIEIPDNKFTLVQDQLKDKPRFIYEQFRMLKNVPVGVDLKTNRLIGIVGEPRDTYSIVDAMVTQIAANNSYTDVKLAFCGTENSAEGYGRWNYIKFLPHNWTNNDQLRFFAVGAADSSEMLYELTDIIRHRAESADVPEIVKPHIVLIVTDVRLLENELISKYVMHPSERLGLTTIFVCTHREQLPNSCNIIIEKTKDFSGIYNTLSTDGEVQTINFDTVELPRLGVMAKRLSNIRINEVENDSNIPSQLDFFEMLGISSLDQLNLVDSWCRNRTYNNMRAVIGKKAGGGDCCLDIYEKYHGPHGLVAGTTGSGKSEILQTYILSLATNFSPEDVSFFLIDFKGGGMANLFLDLPHLIGSISNLAGNQIRRAMISIKSENNRRQTLFNEYGVNNIDAYTRLYKNGEAKVAIPHLVIVIDEFAEMKREGSEEYINELISVAQIGRSLGVHLILATQKPSGTVSDNIWSNSKFKLCLRVQDRKDSNEMLHKPDAAYITQAGRCYLQVGNDELYELFQSGWSGAVYDPENSGKTSIATMITSTGKTAVVGNYTKLKRMEKDKLKWFTSVAYALGKAANDLFGAKSFYDIISAKNNGARAEETAKAAAQILRDQGYNFEGSDVDISCLVSFLRLIPPGNKTLGENNEKTAAEIIRISRERNIRMPELKEKTQLEAVVGYIAEVAKKNGYKRQNSLWLPVLPQKLLLSDISPADEGFDGTGWKDDDDLSTAETAFGLYDDPENQAQLPASVEIGDAGHIALCGSVTSGKSTFLQTLCYSLMNRYDPERLNFYFLDFSSNMLSCFEGFPHVGGVLSSAFPDKIDKFFNLLTKITEQRKKLFGGGNYSQYVRSTGEKIPMILVVIDNYANFKDKTAGKYEEALIRLSREGLSYGIHLVASSAGFGISEIPTRIAENMKTVIALDMGDKYKYAEVFRSIRPTVLPDSEKKGRGLVLVSGRLLEFQTAVAVDAKDDYEAADKLKSVGEAMARAWKGSTAAKIPFIPDEPVLSDLKALDEYNALSKEGHLLPFGYFVDDASVLSVDLRYTYCYTILGKRQSGKTNMLRLLMYAAGMKQGNIVIYEKKTSILQRTAEKYNATYISEDSELYSYVSESLIPEFVRRNGIKKKCIADGLTDEEVYDVMSKEKPVFIFIDDLKDFFESAQKPSGGIGDMSGALGNLISKGKLHNIYFFGCMNVEDYGLISALKLYQPFVSVKKGMLMGASVNSQRLFAFRNIPFSETAKPLKKGNVLVVSDEDETLALKAVLPLVRRDEL